MELEHPVELLVHSYLDNVREGKASMSEENIQGVVKHVEEAVRRQFNKKEARGSFRLRASNIGRASCQLWFQRISLKLLLHLPLIFYYV